MKQEFTSAATSVNSKKLPAIYGNVKIGENETVLDYGCGKFFDNYGLPQNVKGYDPFNRNDPSVLSMTYDKVLCSNVLNVIKEYEVRRELLETLKSLGRTIYITVYEGNGTGKGKVTKKNCYQLNKKRGDYIPELVSVFGAGNVTFKKGCFECKVV